MGRGLDPSELNLSQTSCSRFLGKRFAALALITLLVVGSLALSFTPIPIAQAQAGGIYAYRGTITVRVSVPERDGGITVYRLSGDITVPFEITLTPGRPTQTRTFTVPYSGTYSFIKSSDYCRSRGHAGSGSISGTMTVFVSGLYDSKTDEVRLDVNVAGSKESPEPGICRNFLWTYLGGIGALHYASKQLTFKATGGSIPLSGNLGALDRRATYSGTAELTLVSSDRRDEPPRIPMPEGDEWERFVTLAMEIVNRLKEGKTLQDAGVFDIFLQMADLFDKVNARGERETAVAMLCVMKEINDASSRVGEREQYTFKGCVDPLGKIMLRGVTVPGEAECTKLALAPRMPTADNPVRAVRPGEEASFRVSVGWGGEVPSNGIPISYSYDSDVGDLGFFDVEVKLPLRNRLYRSPGSDLWHFQTGRNTGERAYQITFFAVVIDPQTGQTCRAETRVILHVDEEAAGEILFGLPFALGSVKQSIGRMRSEGLPTSRVTPEERGWMQTDRESFVDFRPSEKSQLILGSESSIILTKVDQPVGIQVGQKQVGQKGELNYELERGKMMLIWNEPREDYLVFLEWGEVWAAAILGTVVLIEVADNQSAFIRVLEGSILVVGRGGWLGEKSFPVTAGEQITTSPDGLPTSPVPIDGLGSLSPGFPPTDEWWKQPPLTKIVSSPAPISEREVKRPLRPEPELRQDRDIASADEPSPLTIAFIIATVVILLSIVITKMRRGKEP